MGKPYSREYEDELLTKLREAGVTDEDLLGAFLVCLSSDQTCEVLEDACQTYDVEYEDEI